MPPLSRRFLQSAAAFLLAGIVLGLVLLVRRELFGRWPAPFLLSAHAHLILVGAVLETILGTALWLFPRAPSDPTPSGLLATWCWWGLTVGTVIRTAAEIGRTWNGAALLRWCVVFGGTLQVVGLVLGLAALRARVRAGTRTG